MNFDPTNVDAIKNLAREHCKEMTDAPSTGKDFKTATLGVEKYLSNEYLDSLDAETRARFLSVYEAESKLFYQERSKIDEIEHIKIMEEMRANHEKVYARIRRTRTIFSSLFFVAIAIAISVAVIRNL